MAEMINGDNGADSPRREEIEKWEELQTEFLKANRYAWWRLPVHLQLSHDHFILPVSAASSSSSLSEMSTGLNIDEAHYLIRGSPILEPYVPAGTNLNAI